MQCLGLGNDFVRVHHLLQIADTVGQTDRHRDDNEVRLHSAISGKLPISLVGDNAAWPARP